MKVRYTCTSTGQMYELCNILTVEAVKHDVTMSDVVIQGNIAEVIFNDTTLMKDFDKAREAIYAQNGTRGWHDLTKDPNDLPPEKCADVFIKSKRGKKYYCGQIIRVYDNIVMFKVASAKCHVSFDSVTAWRYPDNEEVLLHDFFSDVEENLSFVPVREVL